MVPEEPVLWHERCIGRRPIALLLLWLMVVAVLVVTGGETGGGLVLMLAFIVVVAGLLINFLWLDVSITPSTLKIAHGPLRIPSHSVPLSAVTGVEAVHVNPLKHGGWGVRKKTLFIARGGPGLSFTVKDRRWLVTIDGAAEAAAHLQSHRR